MSLVLATLVINLFPADGLDREGFVRMTNRSDAPAEAVITPIDDEGTTYAVETVTIQADSSIHFNSGDLELGSQSKGLVGVGQGVGDWRLVIETDADLDVMAYVRTEDGFVTSLHDEVPGGGGRWRVPFFNPASNVNQVSILRLVNAGDQPADVTVSGTDDVGRVGDDDYVLQIQPGTARRLTAVDLESVYGDGHGKWRLDVRSDRPIVVMSLLESPTGHLTNLSTETRRHSVTVLEDHRSVATMGSGPVAVSVADATGFEDGSHGQRITDTFLGLTDQATLVQVGGWCSHLVNGTSLTGANYSGYIHHAVTRGRGIFWTATDHSPLWTPGRRRWFLEDGRPFTEAARTFASWAKDQNILFVSSLENATCSRSTEDDSCTPVYCDDHDPDSERWIPMCGEIDDYIAHSGVSLDSTLFVGAIDERFGSASGAIRSDGVFAPHTIYVESSNGSTSLATPVLAAYAVNLASMSEVVDSTRLKRRLMELARDETLDYRTGARNAQGQRVDESRTVKVIRPSFAP